MFNFFSFQRKYELFLQSVFILSEKYFYSTTETYRIEFKGHCYMFNTEEYYSIEKLISCHQNPEGRIYLNECIPPSEYGKINQFLLLNKTNDCNLGINVN